MTGNRGFINVGVILAVLAAMGLVAVLIIDDFKKFEIFPAEQAVSIDSIASTEACVDLLVAFRDTNSRKLAIQKSLRNISDSPEKQRLKLQQEALEKTLEVQQEQLGEICPDVEEVEITPSMLSSDISSWESYQDETHGFAIRYPSGLKLTDYSKKESPSVLDPFVTFEDCPLITEGEGGVHHCPHYIGIFVFEKPLSLKPYQPYEGFVTDVTKITLYGRDFYIALTGEYARVQWQALTALGDNKTLSIILGGNEYLLLEAGVKKEKISEEELRRIIPILASLSVRGNH